MMRSTLLSITFVGLLGCCTIGTAMASPGTGSTGGRSSTAFGGNVEDPSFELEDITARRAQRESLLGISPMKWLHDASAETWDDIYEASNLKLGVAINHLFQWASDSLPGEDDRGMTTDMDIIGSWELVNRGEPTLGKLVFGIEGRYDWGTTGPQDVGFVSLGTAGGTANSFSRYYPVFILRNLYWEQGSQAAGWAYRIGKITPDAMLATSRHITPLTTFLSNAGTGFFSGGYPDSGLGAAGVWHPNDRTRILGLVSDARADRTDFGDIDEGDFFKALEFGYKIAPRTKNAGYSKLTFWHIDDTDGTPSNASTGVGGHGVTVKLENELTEDGKMIGILRWGKAWDDSSAFNQQAGVHLLFYDPPGPVLKNDVAGIALNWTDSVAPNARDEYNLEVFYRFALFTGLDTRLSYQYVKDPALTREIDHASVFSLGFRSVF